MSLTVIGIETGSQCYLLAWLLESLGFNDSGYLNIIKVVWPGKSTKILVVEEKGYELLAVHP